ncbi:MAG: hypothetical protein WDZ52_14700 [Pseudohongiellaceae bacterium]
MSHLRLKVRSILTLLFAVLLVFSAQSVLAQGNSQGKGQGKNKNIGVGNASDGIMGRVITNKGIIYTGNPLEISVHFPRGSELISSGSVDAYVVVFAPTVVEEDEAPSDDADSTETTETDSSDGTASALSEPVVIPVSDAASTEVVKLFELEAVDLSTLPGGTYQIGLILTNPGGDPLVIGDWYTGLLGLIDVVGLTVTDEAVDFDEDVDGEVDDDDDGDGFSDEVEDEDPVAS